MSQSFWRLRLVEHAGGIGASEPEPGQLRCPLRRTGACVWRRSKVATPIGLPASGSARRSCSAACGRTPASGRCSRTFSPGAAFEFQVERAVFATVLHRFMAPGSDRACEKWMADYDIPGEDLTLHHFYRAMAWLGEEFPAAEQRPVPRPLPRARQRPDRGAYVREPTRSV